MPVKTCAEQHNERSRGGRSTNNAGYDFLYERIAPYLRKADLAIGNMEFPVSPPYVSKSKIFNCRPEAIDAMKNAGFGIMHIANNHIMDQEPGGIGNTITNLETRGMDFIGAHRDSIRARSGIIKEIAGIRVGFIAYAGWMNYNYPRSTAAYHINWFYDRDKVLEDIRIMRKKCDYLVMVAHFGEEYYADPRDKDRELVMIYCDEGVDLVVGHHPHVVQRAERITAKDGRVCHVFYSLGNFISNQTTRHEFRASGLYLSTRDSILLTMVLARDNGRPIARFVVEPIATINSVDKKGRRVIQTVSLNEEIANLKRAFTSGKDHEKPLLTGEAVTTDMQKRNAADGVAARLASRRAVVKKALFRDNILEEIVFNE
jgi:poly-gamma-glutamate synthesis protein (capsule biosynthesis protein)